MDDQNNRNLLLATGLSFLVVLAWFFVFPPEEPPVQSVSVENQEGTVQGTATGEFAVTPPVADDLATVRQPAAEPVAEAQRLPIETPNLVGSILLTGGRLDDLSLNRYQNTLSEDSGNVRLLSPSGTAEPYYALFGWAPAGSLGFTDVPGSATTWKVESGTELSPGNPVTLVWNNGKGLQFRRTMSVDDKYMFTIQQSVVNSTGAPVRMAPYGIIARHGEPDGYNFFILHEGMIQMADSRLTESDYGDIEDFQFEPREAANTSTTEVLENGWIGFTDKYWMTTLIPSPGQSFNAVTKYTQNHDVYQTEARLPTIEVATGNQATVDTRLFAGAKEWEAIRNYEEEFSIDRYVDSIDWGWFFFLTKPIFIALHWLNSKIGNMGWSIICLTVIIKAFLFPLAYKSYVSIAKMKELQPEMEKIKEQAGDDRKMMQQKTMELYRTRKINPAAGCLPILPQIPIFFSLYKVIFVTIELRHAPFILWIRDLSAPDPTSILNLFGALPWGTPDPGSLFAIVSLGVLPILLGISMWLQQKLNPAPTDPTQAMIFAWMPWIFMFMLGQFASGLIVYWIANNVITFAQQYLIMRSQGVRPDVIGNIVDGIRKTLRRTAAGKQEAKKPEPEPEPDPDPDPPAALPKRKSRRKSDKPRRRRKQ